MKICIAVYLLSILIIILEYVTTMSKVKKYVGKNLYKAYKRRESISVCEVILSLIGVLCPGINTIFAFCLLSSEKETYNDCICDIRDKCEEYGIDFDKSKLEYNKDYIDSLEELEGIRRL